MHKLKLPGFLIMMVLLVSCSGSEYSTAESGVNYMFAKKGDGPEPVDGNVLILNVSYINEPGNIIFSTAQAGNPMIVGYSDSLLSQNGSLEEGIRMVRGGDSLIMKFPIEKLFETTFNLTLPDSLERGTEVTVCIGVDKVLTQEEFGVYRMKIREEQQAAALDRDRKRLEEEEEIIDTYLESNNIDSRIHTSGLRYVILKEGEGDYPEIQQKVSVHYTGKLLDGKVFDTSHGELAKESRLFNAARSYEPFKFTLGTGSVIQGWDIGIGLLKEGGKGVLYIPSKLAYGERGAGGIPPNSILIFDVELVNVN